RPGRWPFPWPWPAARPAAPGPGSGPPPGPARPAGTTAAIGKTRALRVLVRKTWINAAQVSRQARTAAVRHSLPHPAGGPQPAEIPRAGDQLGELPEIRPQILGPDEPIS